MTTILALTYQLRREVGRKERKHFIVCAISFYLYNSLYKRVIASPIYKWLTETQLRNLPKLGSG